MHMPAPFTKSFAQRLDRICAPRVHEATHGAPLVARQHLYRAGLARPPGGVAAPSLRCVLREGEPVSGHRPSVDALFHSVARNRRRQGGRRDPDRHGRATARKACWRCARRRAHARAERGDLRRLRHAEGRLNQIGAVEKQAPLNSIAAEVAALTTRNRDWTVMAAANQLEVMVVDDTSVSRMLMTESLRRSASAISRSPRTATRRLSQLKSKPVHLVISDQYMPNLDGLGLLKALRRPRADGQDRLHSGHRQPRQIAGRARPHDRSQQLHRQAFHDQDDPRGDRGGGGRLT